MEETNEKGLMASQRNKTMENEDEDEEFPLVKVKTMRAVLKTFLEPATDPTSRCYSCSKCLAGRIDANKKKKGLQQKQGKLSSLQKHLNCNGQ